VAVLVNGRDGFLIFKIDKSIKAYLHLVKVDALPLDPLSNIKKIEHKK
jgi:hypothetical protein